MRELTSAEIEKFASAKGVKRIAVENFLSSLDSSIGVMGNTMNMQMDAQMYKWNTATQRAIEAGIRAANKPQTIGSFGYAIGLACRGHSHKKKSYHIRQHIHGYRKPLGKFGEDITKRDDMPDRVKRAFLKWMPMKEIKRGGETYVYTGDIRNNQKMKDETRDFSKQQGRKSVFVEDKGDIATACHYVSKKYYSELSKTMYPAYGKRSL